MHQYCTNTVHIAEAQTRFVENQQRFQIVGYRALCVWTHAWLTQQKPKRLCLPPSILTAGNRSENHLVHDHTSPK